MTWTIERRDAGVGRGGAVGHTEGEPASEGGRGVHLGRGPAGEDAAGARARVPRARGGAEARARAVLDVCPPRKRPAAGKGEIAGGATTPITPPGIVGGARQARVPAALRLVGRDTIAAPRKVQSAAGGGKPRPV